jgi:hypothetical protein
VRLSTNAVQALCKLLRRFDLAIGGRDLGDLVDQDGGQRGTDAQRATGNKPILAAGFGAIAEGSPQQNCLDHKELELSIFPTVVPRSHAN